MIKLFNQNEYILFPILKKTVKCFPGIFIVISITVLFASCGSDSPETDGPDPSPTSHDIHFDEPEVYSPGNGTKIHHNPSPLIINNIANPDNISILYDFELYRIDSEQPVQSLSMVPGGMDGLTRWDLASSLMVRNIYQWRARASTDDGVKGPWMSNTAFYVFDTGNNYSDLYVAFGDSITGGYGSSTYGTLLPGYQHHLEPELQDFYGSARITTHWIGGSYTFDGANAIESILIRYKPSVILILFGTHDTVIAQIEEQDIMNHINTMVTESLARSTRPILGTIPPVNPHSIYAYRQPVIDQINKDIHDYALRKGVAVATINADFWAAADNNADTLATFYYDHEHPNDEGYKIIANAWYEAIIGKY